MRWACLRVKCPIRGSKGFDKVGSGRCKLIVNRPGGCDNTATTFRRTIHGLEAKNVTDDVVVERLLRSLECAEIVQIRGTHLSGVCVYRLCLPEIWPGVSCGGV